MTLVIAGCTYVPTASVVIAPKSDHPETTPLAVPTPEVNGISIESIMDETDEYIVAYHYPVIGNSFVDALNKKSAEDTVSKFISNASNSLTDFEKKRGQRYELYSNFETYKVDGALVSFVQTTSILNPGMDKPDERSTVETFDIKQNKKLELSDILAGNADQEALNALSSAVSSAIERDNLLGDNYDKGWVDRGILPNVENFSMFAMDNQSIIFFFPPYQIAPAEAETVKVCLPYSSVLSILAEPYSSTVSLDSQIDITTPSTTFARGDDDKDDEFNIFEEEPSADPSVSPAVPLPTPSPREDLPEGEKYIAITFDDGPHAKNTPRLLDILAKYNAKATFFVLGDRAQYAKNVVKRAYDEGHEIGNHSYDHKKLTTLSSSDMKSEIVDTNDIVESITGERPVLFRPPYGEKDEAVEKTCVSENMSIILWNIDTTDWKIKDPAVVAQNIVDTAKPGNIILLHDIHETSVDAAEIAIKELTEKGYKFVTVSELLGSKAQPGKTFRHNN